MSKKKIWKARDLQVSLDEGSLLVGILNVTPDSFFDGGSFEAVESAIARGLALMEEGARIVDIGGESTRPGFKSVSVEEEKGRVVPVVEGLVSSRADCILSIDTSKALVAAAALEAGARVVNDVWGFQRDLELAKVAARFSAGVIVMRNGRDGEARGSVLDRIRSSWERSLDILGDAGVSQDAVALDPGIGFGTTRQEDLEILRGLDVLRSFGFPLMLGASRKRITGQPAGLAAGLRLEATLATTVMGIAAGVELFRVHDVAENARVVGLADLVYGGGSLDD